MASYFHLVVARTINLGNKNVKICIFTGGTSVRSKNIFTDISRYLTGKHEIISSSSSSRDGSRSSNRSCCSGSTSGSSCRKEEEVVVVVVVVVVELLLK